MNVPFQTAGNHSQTILIQLNTYNITVPGYITTVQAPVQLHLTINRHLAVYAFFDKYSLKMIFKSVKVVF